MICLCTVWKYCPVGSPESQIDPFLEKTSSGGRKGVQRPAYITFVWRIRVSVFASDSSRPNTNTRIIETNRNNGDILVQGNNSVSRATASVGFAHLTLKMHVSLSTVHIFLSHVLVLLRSTSTIVLGSRASHDSVLSSPQYGSCLAL